MAFLDFLFGSEDKTKQLPTMTPEQEQVLSQLLSSLGQEGQLGGLYGRGLAGLGELLDPSEQAFGRFADPYMRQFEEQTIPGIAERFAGGGALSSSGFGQALSSAAGGLQENLASLKAQLQQKAIGDILGQYQSMTGLGLGQKPFGYQQIQGSPGLLGGIAQGAAEKFGEGLGNFGSQGIGALATKLGFGG